MPGLTLAEPDYITLALELAVREVPAGSEILDEQLGRIQNPDRKARFAFVRPALVSRPRDPRRVLRQPRGRAEPPAARLGARGARLPPPPAARRGPRSTSRASLELLREIQRTGDIFFPKRWTDATLSGHQSASAARRVREFLEKLPEDYPERLRRVILSSSDDLIRARRIRER